MEPELQAQIARFENLYVRAQAPVMREVERRSCGCSYGATSWTTVEEARDISAILGLQPGVHLLDLGAGSGWPGLFLARLSGCDLTLVDLPLAGLRIARDRAASDGLSDLCWTLVADAAQLPFRDASFDAVSHSDLLCCLVEKEAVLESCRRIVRDSGMMLFTVISIAPGLSPSEFRRAVEGGPQYVEAPGDYPTMLQRTGWAVRSRKDVTAAFQRSISSLLDAFQERKPELEQLIGPAQFAEECNKNRMKREAVRDGLLCRELFLAAPALAGP